MPSRAQPVVTALFAGADIRMDGARPWDLRIHDERFFPRFLAGGTLGFGEAYMEGWWGCDALDDMCCRAARAHLEEHLPITFKTAAATLAANLFNLQTLRRSRRVAEVHYDLGNDFFAAMLGPDLQYSCAYFRGTSDLAEAQRRKMDLICRKLDLQP